MKIPFHKTLDELKFWEIAKILSGCIVQEPMNSPYVQNEIDRRRDMVFLQLLKFPPMELKLLLREFMVAEGLDPITTQWLVRRPAGML